MVLLAVAVAATGGCGLFNEIHQTQITVEYSGDQLLHLATIPRQLPDGQRPTEQVEALLEEIAERAGGYTYIENVMGGWMPPEGEKVVEERNDLLLVKGPPEVKPYLQQRLREDFQQEMPFVISLPVQSVAVIRSMTPQEQRRARAAEQE
jgi:hypothetical protein